MRWFLVLVLPVAVLSQCISEDDRTPRNDSSARIALYKGQQKFSIDFLRAMNEERKGQNIFFSPHSIYQSVLLAYFSAANETEKMLQKALHIPESQDKISTFQTFQMEKYFQETRHVQGPLDYQYQIANKFFVANTVPTRKCIEELFHDEFEKVDFAADPKGALEHINGWVANLTRNQIKDLVPADAVGIDTSLILANAAYFKGFWKSKFLKEQTKINEVFHSTTSVLRHVDMMRQKGTFNYMLSERLKAHILEMPYKGGDISMVVILPRFENGALDKLISQLSEETLAEILDLDSLYPRPVEVEFPKFTVEESIDLTIPFKKLGLSGLFENSTDFSALTEHENDIHFTDAIHKSRVDVDEEGTEAAAATAVFSFRSSRPLEPTIFKANHPFMYLIFDKVTQNILFMGAYQLPAKKAFARKRRF